METSVIVGFILVNVIAVTRMDDGNNVDLSPMDLASGQAETHGAHRIYKTLDECNSALKKLVFKPDESPTYLVELFPDDYIVATRVEQFRDGENFSKISCSPLRDVVD